MTYSVPEVVVVSQRGSGLRHATTTVECEAEFAVLEIKSDEINVLLIGHVEHDAVWWVRL